MAKKDKKGDHTVQNKEIFQRMNFLYQAAMCMATITTPPPRPSASKVVGSQTNAATESQSQGAIDSAVKDPATQESMKESTFVSTVPTTATTTSVIDVNMENRHQSPRKLSRKKTRKLLRDRKNRIALEQISDNVDHHRLTNPSNGSDPRPLSGTARFYASTLMEVGRKNVIRMRYFCMPGKGIEGDRWESEEAVNTEGNDIETAQDSTTTSTATTPAETHDFGNDNVGMEDSVIESAQEMEDLILQNAA
ncbi:hypothetical protein BGW39_004114 [Mortierella sp. 14UC]|nr:hypothetical protein BGW39_004114 [Mortierella sp. 14UC]